MEQEMKVRFTEEYSKRVRLVFELMLNGQNKFETISKHLVSIPVKIGAGVIIWIVDELQSLDRKTRKLLIMYRAFYHRSDILCISKKRGKELIGCESCVRAEEYNVAWYINNATEPLLLEVGRLELLNIDDCKGKTCYK